MHATRKPKRQRQPRLCPYWVARLELGDLRLAPSMKAELGFWPERLNALRGIVSTQADLNGMLHHRAMRYRVSQLA